MRRFFAGALAGLGAAIAVAAPALAGPTVTVRVEGANGTLLDSTRVTLPDTDTIACGAGGPHTVADALELATGGNWDRQEFARTIMGETHPGSPDFWAEWIGSNTGYRPGQGVCEDVLKEGEEALMYATVFTTPATHFPLDLEGLPTTVEAGSPVTVTVVAYESQDFLTATRVPVAGATVSGGGASAVTGADGTAVLSFAQPGEASVRASKSGSVISAAERVTVTAPGVAPPPTTPSALRPDTTAPTATISGLRNGQVFSRKRAPRTLRGTVSSDPSGIKSVRLSILRKKGGKCWAFDGDSEQFKRHRCGGSRSFRIGDRAEWSYLLPERLRRGRYTIRVVAIDNAGNDAVTRTRIRVR
jgi:hypothetical protein